MKKDNNKVNAAIIIIGNEILSGRTQDVNVVAISEWLNELGIKLNEVRIIPDVQKKIIKTIKEIRRQHKYVFTTGGIGPTHDDITARSVAKAFNLTYGYHKQAYALLEKYYGKDAFNLGRKKMAKMPTKAKLILNPTSGAPGFNIYNIFCLPGVPSILKSMLGGLKNEIVGGKKVLNKTITLKTVESEIARPLEKVQNNYKKVEIGSYPFFKKGRLGVSIVLRSTEKKQIDLSYKQIVNFIKKKKIEIVG
tara:strand:+ start:2539 stop:3288 length:750 start_codon:yes stop_codon:yes gene_type:complete